MSAYPSPAESGPEIKISSLLEAISFRVEQLTAERDELERENERLTKENLDLLDELYLAREAIAELQAMVQRAVCT